MKQNILETIKKHEILFLTLISGIIGATFFLWIYGIEVLDVTNENWLLKPGDLAQHYLGWTFFRKADWSFPIGLYDTLSYPNYVSIIFSDSIPLFAIFFKTISNFLPETFQYFGIFGLMCYILQGIFAFTLLRKFINNKFYAIIGSVFFIISPYMLERMFSHTSLAANFLLLAGFCIWAYRDKYKDNLKKKIFLWTFLLAICSSIHLYYIPMVLIIMFCTFICEFIENRKTWKSSIATFIISCISVIIVLYVLGGFMKVSNFHYYMQLGFFNINLNTFVNPQGFSGILKNLENATGGEYEANGYLGFGIIIMSIISIVVIFQNYNKKEFIKLIKRPNTIFVLLCFLIGTMVAIGTCVKINERILFYIHYPTFIKDIMSIFKAIGRFIWISSYVIFFVSMCVVGKYNKNKVANLVIVMCLLLQFIDLNSSITNKFKFTENAFQYDEEKWEKVLNNCEHIVCIGFQYGEEDRFLRMAYIAKENNCTMNSFYYAREIPILKETEEKYLDNLKRDIIEENVVYVLKNTDKELTTNTKLYCYDIDGYIVITLKEYEDLEKINM